MTSESRRPAPAAPICAVLSTLAAPALFAIAVAIALPCGEAHAQDAPKTDDEKAFYAIGAGYGQQLRGLGEVSDRELDLFVRAIRDAVAGEDLAVDPQTARPMIQAMVQSRQQKALAAEKAASAAFVAEQGKLKGAKTTASGLVYIETKAGTGDSPAAADKVRVHYHGTLRDGTVFDSSVERNEPAEFALNRVIPCWTEGVAMMKAGGKSTLICPSSIAYGDRGQGAISPGASLRFEVELLDVLK